MTTTPDYSFKVPTRFRNYSVEYVINEVDDKEEEEVISLRPIGEKSIRYEIKRGEKGFRIDLLSDLMKYTMQSYRFPYYGYILFVATHKIFEFVWNECQPTTKWMILSLICILYLHWFYTYMKKEDSNPVVVVGSITVELITILVVMILLDFGTLLEASATKLYLELICGFPFIVTLLFILWLMNNTDLFAFVDHKMKTIEFSNYIKRVSHM